jgi:hypothetical protein
VVVIFEVFASQLVDAELLYNLPRKVEQSDGSVEVHPAGSTPHVWYEAVEMRTLTLCAGVPISIVNEDHGPLLPSLLVVSLPLRN